MRHGQYRFIAGFLVAAPGVVCGLRDLAVRPGVLLLADQLDRRLAAVRLRRAAELPEPAARLAVPARRAEQRWCCWWRCRLAVILLALFYAFLLNVAGRGSGAGVRGVRGVRLLQAGFFLPQVLSVPVIAVIWAVILDPTPTGLANSAAAALRLRLAGMAGRPQPGPVLRAVGPGLGQRRVLPGAVQRRHVLDPEGPVRGGADRRGGAGGDVLPGHHAVAVGHHPDVVGVPGRPRPRRLRAGRGHDRRARAGRPTPPR